MRQLETHYENKGSWDDLGTVAVRGRRPNEFYPAPVTVLDVNRVVVYSRDYTVGEPLPAQERHKGVAVEVNDETVGWVLLNRIEVPGIPDNSPEAAFLVSMRWSILIGSAVALVVALIVGIFLARTLTRPLSELTAATRALAQGALGQQVPVRSNDELGELATSFNHMSADLAASVRQRRQMTADIAHDLRTPLSVILGYTEALSDGKIPGSPEIFQVVHGEAQHLQRLIEDLRLLSLADAGELSLNRQTLTPYSVLERSVIAHAVRALDKSIDLRLDAPSDLPELSADPERLAQVFGNLVSNAIRHTPHNGQIVLSATHAADEVQLHVTDTGAGIAAEDLPFIFDRFYRADSSRTQMTGESGLGLAIARSLVEAHGGRISVDSTVGVGTTFTVALPVAA
ncbi:MAG: HAMP domain-containing sensor histidine kinase [Caldilineaceae bacterium]